MNHEHYCGHTDAEEVREGAPRAAEGCGHIWEHDRDLVFFRMLEKGHESAKRLNEEQHTCPKCGKGPWYLIYKGTRSTENDAPQSSQ